MEKCKLDFEKYKNRFKELYPSYTEEQHREIFELRVSFWYGIIEKYDEIGLGPID